MLFLLQQLLISKFIYVYQLAKRTDAYHLVSCWRSRPGFHLHLLTVNWRLTYLCVLTTSESPVKYDPKHCNQNIQFGHIHYQFSWHGVTFGGSCPSSIRTRSPSLSWHWSRVISRSPRTSAASPHQLVFLRCQSWPCRPACLIMAARQSCTVILRSTVASYSGQSDTGLVNTTVICNYDHFS